MNDLDYTDLIINEWRTNKWCGGPQLSSKVVCKHLTGAGRGGGGGALNIMLFEACWTWIGQYDKIM